MKKEYISPSISVVEAETEMLLAGSGGTEYNTDLDNDDDETTFPEMGNWGGSDYPDPC